MSEVLFETRGPILIVTFNRPDVGNAFTGFMAKILHDKLRVASEDRSVRAVLLRGAGGNFMSGNDMAAYMGDPKSINDIAFAKIQYFYSTIRDLQFMEKPVISMVNGRVSGAGINFILASDIVIAGRQTVFSAGYTDNAIVPDGGITFLLPRKVGTTRAIEMLMLNEDFTADTAEQWGLVNRVIDDSKLEQQTFAMVERLAAKATRTLGAAKRLVSKSFEQDLNTQLASEASYFNEGLKTFDFREAVKALAAKREPKYTGS
jgi:2-(1,2-epoxy-1,2-dihydrophenyl)acetyl-CoA isomerase